ETAEDQAYDQDTDLQLLTALFEPLESKTAIDIGAEKGSFVRAFLKRGARSVIAIEPHPGNAAVLREQFACEAGVQTIEVAVGKRDQVATLHVAEDKTGRRPDAYHSLVEFDETSTIRRVDRVQVQVRTLDSLVAEGAVPPHVDVLKIDAERSDFDVVQGMGRLFASVVMLEYWDDLP